MTKNTLSNIIHPLIYLIPLIDILFKCNISQGFLELMILSWIILRNNCVLSLINDIDIERGNSLDIDNIFIYNSKNAYI